MHVPFSLHGNVSLLVFRVHKYILETLWVFLCVSVHQGWKFASKSVCVYAFCQCEAASSSLLLMAHYFSLEAAVTLVAALTGETSQTAALIFRLINADTQTHTQSQIQLHESQ